jgi:hypothetical protein
LDEVRRERPGRYLRPDNSQIRGGGASAPGVMVGAARLASGDDPLPAGRAARLSGALAGLAQELAAARREVAILKRENMALRATLDRGASDG